MNSSQKTLNPLGNDQTFTAYQKRGYEFNILMGQGAQVRPWLLSKYCNCLAGKNERSQFDFVIEGGEWFKTEEVFFTDIIRARKDLSLPLQNSLIHLIINRLENGSYVYGYFDEYHIKSKNAYQINHFKHSFLVYGYDNNDKLFYAIGYTNNNKFDKYTIPYDDFLIALTSLNNIELTFVLVNPNFDFSMKIELIYYGLYDYIHSISSSAQFDMKAIYGIDTIYEFARYVDQSLDAHKNLDLRYSKFFMEFKLFMQERLEYLYDNGYISNWHEDYSQICKVFQSIHLLFIKYNITNAPTIAQNISQMIKNSISKERIILSNVVTELKKNLIIKNNQNYI